MKKQKKSAKRRKTSISKTNLSKPRATKIKSTKVILPIAHPSDHHKFHTHHAIFTFAMIFLVMILTLSVNKGIWSPGKDLVGFAVASNQEVITVKDSGFTSVDYRYNSAGKYWEYKGNWLGWTNVNDMGWPYSTNNKNIADKLRDTNNKNEGYTVFKEMNEIYIDQIKFTYTPSASTAADLAETARLETETKKVAAAKKLADVAVAKKPVADYIPADEIASANDEIRELYKNLFPVKSTKDAFADSFMKRAKETKNEDSATESSSADEVSAVEYYYNGEYNSEPPTDSSTPYYQISDADGDNVLIQEYTKKNSLKTVGGTVIIDVDDYDKATDNNPPDYFKDKSNVYSINKDSSGLFFTSTNNPLGDRLKIKDNVLDYIAPTSAEIDTYIKSGGDAYYSKSDKFWYTTQADISSGKAYGVTYYKDENNKPIAVIQYYVDGKPNPTHSVSIVDAGLLKDNTNLESFFNGNVGRLYNNVNGQLISDDGSMFVLGNRINGKDQGTQSKIGYGQVNQLSFDKGQTYYKDGDYWIPGSPDAAHRDVPKLSKTSFGGKEFVLEQKVVDGKLLGKIYDLAGSKANGIIVEVLYDSESKEWSISKKDARALGIIVEGDDKDRLVLKDIDKGDGKVLVGPTDVVSFSDFAAGLVDPSNALYTGNGLFSTIFSDDKKVAAAKEKWDMIFAENYLGTQYFDSAICKQHIGRAGSNTGVVDLGYTLTQAVHIEGERAASISYINESSNQLVNEYLYKFTVKVENPSGYAGSSTYGPDKKIGFNIYLFKASGQKIALYNTTVILKDGDSFVRSGSSMIAKYSPNLYTKVCIIFTAPIKVVDGALYVDQKEFCNKVNEYSGKVSKYAGNIPSSSSSSSSGGSGVKENDPVKDSQNQEESNF